jgi:hypothetical protein
MITDGGGRGDPPPSVPCLHAEGTAGHGRTDGSGAVPQLTGTHAGDQAPAPTFSLTTRDEPPGCIVTP